MNFEEQVHQLAEEHQLFNYNRFNIFNVMFKPHDEKYLHSRFIAFLLDPNGSHRQGTLFLELFLQVMDIANFSLDGVSVNPNERERGEIYNIDILIKNASNQAIIVENKFFAKDQTRPEENDPYLKYQLSRYYHSLVIKPKDYIKYDVVKIIYLTIDGKKPEDLGDFPIEVKALISKKDHLSDIAKWLDLCLQELNEDSNLRRSIQQYKQARYEFLNDVQLALNLKEISGREENLDDAFLFWNNKSVAESQELKLIREQFIHIKWHTVHEFYTKLTNRIHEEFKVEVTEVDKEKITAVTHFNSKTPTLLTFKLQDVLYYVCNDKNGFSIGRHVDNKTEADFQILFDKNYAFFDFSRHEVFQLMNTNESEKLAREIINALTNFINK